ncbi:hypothetical protein [Azospirillum rugosum]|uniref:DUF4243 domain-containing protein n=1 Tax=Azospirillum rugosum TaxID=416170 RepID=A0ABS4SE87_9PROT|nr:hypothetical protein [Azospirillum rugosum]MBP2290889.1 hypothetical protein [Azospirillum rugosum]MDQ0525047.1 hypothetical protein [Azospirillum rugosum]
MGLDYKAAGAGRYDTVRRLLSRLDQQTCAKLLDHLGDLPADDDRPVSPMRAMLIQLLRSRRWEHTRRLWARWLEPVILRDPRLLGTPTPPPGLIHAGDLPGWWTALSRRMGEVPAGIRSCIEERLSHATLGEVLASDEAARWSDFLRLRSLAILQGLHNDPAALAAFLDDANAERLRSACGSAAPDLWSARKLTAADAATLTTALRVAPSWPRLGGRAADAEVEDLLSGVRGVLTGGGMPPDAMALYAVAGMYAQQDPLLAAALRALLPLPLVDAAVAWLASRGGAGMTVATGLPPMHADQTHANQIHADQLHAGHIRAAQMRADQARGLDHGLRALFDTALSSGRPLSPADAKRLGRALAGVVDVHSPQGHTPQGHPPRGAS